MAQVLEIVRIEEKVLLVGRFPVVRVKGEKLAELTAYVEYEAMNSPSLSGGLVTCDDLKLNEGFVAFRVADHIVAEVPGLVERLSRELLQMVALTPCTAGKGRLLPNFSI